MMKSLKILSSIPLANNNFYILSKKLLNKSNGGYILSFHDLPSSKFEEHVKALLPAKPISLDELIIRYKANKSIDNCFAITFDDGVKNTVKENFKICKKNSWPVTFYLPTDYLNGDNLPFQKIEILEKYLKETEYDLPEILRNDKKLLKKNNLMSYLKKIIYIKDDLFVKKVLDHFLDFLDLMQKKDMPEPISWSDVREINKDQISSFQSHGVTHTACSALSESKLKYELKKSKQIIEDHLGNRVTSFCYPYGSAETINKMSIKIASEIYESASTLIRGRLKNKNIYYLPRIDLYKENPISLVRLKILISK
tara:strand:+ start:195 stop:1127 length:933 start_codon:yes stop_codon:yes gene_type:complete